MSREPKLLARGAIDIRRTPHDTFRYVANLENFPAWFPGVAGMRALDGLEHGRAGKRYRETLRLPLGRSGTVDIEVREARPGALLLTEGGGMLLPSMRVDLVAVGGDTRLQWSMVSRSTRWWMRALVVPLLRREMGRRAQAGLARLKQLLERGA